MSTHTIFPLSFLPGVPAFGTKSTDTRAPSISAVPPQSAQWPPQSQSLTTQRTISPQQNRIAGFVTTSTQVRSQATPERNQRPISRTPPVGSMVPARLKNDHRPERRWLLHHGQAYRGQWVALQGEALLSFGPTAVKVYQAARAKGIAAPYVVLAEADNQPPFAGW